MTNPIKKLMQKIRKDYNFVVNYLAVENFLQKVEVPEELEITKWSKKRTFILLFFKRFFRLGDKFWYQN